METTPQHYVCNAPTAHLQMLLNLSCVVYHWIWENNSMERTTLVRTHPFPPFPTYRERTRRKYTTRQQRPLC